MSIVHQIRRGFIHVQGVGIAIRVGAPPLAVGSGSGNLAISGLGMGFFVPVPSTPLPENQALAFWHPDDSSGGGATGNNWFCQYISDRPKGAGPWVNKTGGGDWRDSTESTANATGSPYGTATFTNQGGDFTVSIPVTNLVNSWISLQRVNSGFTLRGLLQTTFRGRRFSDTTRRPILRIVRSTSQQVDIACESSTDITTGDTAVPNTSDTFRVGGGFTGLLWFDLTPHYLDQPLLSATLILRASAFSGAGQQTVSVFRTHVEAAKNLPVVTGQAQSSTQDAALKADYEAGLANFAAGPVNGVIFVDRCDSYTIGQAPNFLSTGWDRAIGGAQLPGWTVVGDTDAGDAQYEPLAPGIKAMKMILPAGTGSFSFGTPVWSVYGAWGARWPGYADALNGGPFSIRHYMRFGNNWPVWINVTTAATGKMPGWSIEKMQTGTSAIGAQANFNAPCSWSLSGFLPDGGNGRGTSSGARSMAYRGYLVGISQNSPGGVPTRDLDGHIFVNGNGILGAYGYWAEQTSQTGTITHYGNQGTHYHLPNKNEWFCIEYRITPNTIHTGTSAPNPIFLSNRTLTICNSTTVDTTNNLGLVPNTTLAVEANATDTVLTLTLDCTKFDPNSGKGCAGLAVNVGTASMTISSIVGTTLTLTAGLPAGSYPIGTVVTFPDDAVRTYTNGINIGNSSGRLYHWPDTFADAPVIQHQHAAPETPDSAVVYSRDITGGGIGNKDGVYEVYVDGRLAHREENWRIRHVPDIAMGAPYLNFQVGGTVESVLADTWLYMTAFVICKNYVGPMNLQSAPVWTPSTAGTWTIVNDVNGPAPTLVSVEPNGGLLGALYSGVNASQGFDSQAVFAWTSSLWAPDYDNGKGAFVHHAGGHASYAGTAAFYMVPDDRRWYFPVMHDLQFEGDHKTGGSVFTDDMLDADHKKWHMANGGGVFPPHNYDAICYLPPSAHPDIGPNGMYVEPCRNAVYGTGNSQRAVGLDLSTNVWVRLTGEGDVQGIDKVGSDGTETPLSCEYDPITRKIYLFSAFNGATQTMTRLWAMNLPATNLPLANGCTFQLITPTVSMTPTTYNQNVTSIFWPGHNVILMLMPIPGFTPFKLRFCVYNPATNTITQVPISGPAYNATTGYWLSSIETPQVAYGGGMCYCSDNDSFYCVPTYSANVSPRLETIKSLFKLTPNSVSNPLAGFTITEEILTPPIPNKTGPFQHKRMAYHSRSKSLLWWNSSMANVTAYRPLGL